MIEEKQLKIFELLNSIGFSDNESKIYLDLLESGKSTAGEISRRTKIHRSTVYGILDLLVGKGIVKKLFNTEKVGLFEAYDFNRIKNYLHDKEKEIDYLSQYVNKFFEKDKSIEGEEISITKGIFAVREALVSLLDLNMPIRVLGIPAKANELLGEGFLKEFHNQRIKKKISMQVIYARAAEERASQLQKLKFTETKCFSEKETAFLSSTNIVGDVLLIIVFSEPIRAVMIKSKIIGETLLRYFNILWERCQL
jgi:sugar-specific transcriptional regulator TrmB